MVRTSTNSSLFSAKYGTRKFTTRRVQLRTVIFVGNSTKTTNFTRRTDDPSETVTHSAPSTRPLGTPSIPFSWRSNLEISRCLRTLRLCSSREHRAHNPSASRRDTSALSNQRGDAKRELVSRRRIRPPLETTASSARFRDFAEPFDVVKRSTRRRRTSSHLVWRTRAGERMRALSSLLFIILCRVLSTVYITVEAYAIRDFVGITILRALHADTESGYTFECVCF